MDGMARVLVLIQGALAPQVNQKNWGFLAGRHQICAGVGQMWWLVLLATASSAFAQSTTTAPTAVAAIADQHYLGPFHFFSFLPKPILHCCL
jgi:hypothetical protein